MAADTLKTRTLRYYRAKADVYDERYRVPVAGDLLWERHHAIIDLVLGLPLAPGARILDLGCGPGVLCADLARRGYAGVGMDGAEVMIRRCRAAVMAEDGAPVWGYAVGDVEAVPFAENSFDLVVCSGVIDYVSTDDELIREASRVLKPGGHFLLSVTNKYGYTVCLSSLGYHVKRIPGVLSVASWLRRLMTGNRQGVMSFDFVPRKHRPATIRAALRRRGFAIERDQYLHFTLLPAPFCYLWAKARRGAVSAGTLGRLDRSPLRGLGSCYLLQGKLET